VIDPPLSVVGLWRYPVKSMLGEELNAAEVTERGLVGDRQFAVVDRETGKIAGAKNPRKWGNFFDFRAAYTEPPRAGSELPEVRLTLPDGSHATSDQPDLEQTLSHALGREVGFARAQSDRGDKAEEYWPDMDGLDFRDTVTDFELPEGTFFDLAVVHLLTTGTIDRLRELHPEGRYEARRFRPNIVVSTPELGFVENDWIGQTVAIGDDVRLEIAGPCGRCVMTTLSQGDLPKDPGILRLRRRRRRRNDPSRRLGHGRFVDISTGRSSPQRRGGKFTRT
jgi:uncharacterized protein YcbX